MFDYAQSAEANPPRLGDLTRELKKRATSFTDAHWTQALVRAKGSAAAMQPLIENSAWFERAQLLGIAKAAVASATTSDSGFQNAFSPVAQAFLGRVFRHSFIEQVRAQFFQMPVGTLFFVNSGGFVAAGASESGSAIVLKGSTANRKLTYQKDMSITVSSDELADSASPVGMAGVLDELAKANGESRDRRFFSTSSGGVLYGASNFSASGSTLAAITVDFTRLFNSLPAIGNGKCVLAMSAEDAVFYATLLTSTGAQAFPLMSPAGGQMFGVPVIASPALADEASPPSRKVALVSPSEIFLTSEQPVEIVSSKQAAIEQTDSPSGAAQLVSTFQTSSTAIRSVLYSDWYARSGSAVYMATGY